MGEFTFRTPMDENTYITADAAAGLVGTSTKVGPTPGIITAAEVDGMYLVLTVEVSDLPPQVVADTMAHYSMGEPDAG